MDNTPEFRRLYQGVLDHILSSKGHSSEADRRAAFDNSGLTDAVKLLIDKVAKYAYRVTNDDIDAVKAAGKSEDEIFELVICGAVGQASRQYMGALIALQEVLKAGKGETNAS